MAQNVFLYASVISAAFISGERFYATYWPLKHRALTARAYRVLISSVWLLALLASAIFALGIQLYSSKLASYALLLFFCISVTTFCGCNIAIWRKFQHRNIGDSQQQNRVEQLQRLNKTLFIVSVVALFAWLPSVIMNCLLVVFKVSLPWGIYLLTLVVNFSNSFVNPILYALRIPEFREAMVSVCCLRRQVVTDREGKQRRLITELSLWHQGQPAKNWELIKVIAKRKLWTRNCDQPRNWWLFFLISSTAL